MESKQSRYLVRASDQVTSRKYRARARGAIRSNVRQGTWQCIWAKSWSTGTFRLEVTGGTDMVEGRPRQTKAYTESLSVKLNTHLINMIDPCWYSIKQSSMCSRQISAVRFLPRFCPNSKTSIIGKTTTFQINTARYNFQKNVGQSSESNSKTRQRWRYFG